MISFTPRQKPQITQSTTNILRERDETKFVVRERGGELERPLGKQKYFEEALTRLHVVTLLTYILHGAESFLRSQQVCN